MFLWDRLYWQTKREILADIVAQVHSPTNITDNKNNNTKKDIDKTKTWTTTSKIDDNKNNSKDNSNNNINNKTLTTATIISTTEILTTTASRVFNDANEKVDTEPVVPVNTNSDYEYEEDILPTYIK